MLFEAPALPAAVSVFGDHDSKVRLKGFGVMNEKLSKAEDGTNLSRIFYHGDDALAVQSTKELCQVQNANQGALLQSLGINLHVLCAVLLEGESLRAIRRYILLGVL